MTDAHPTDPLLPSDLRARGWRTWGANSVVRLDGPPSSPFSASCRHNPEGWHGYLEWAGRRLRDGEPTAEMAIRALEGAEAEGLFSSRWREQQRLYLSPGWIHGVSHRRDCWYAVVDSPRMALVVDLILMVAPAVYRCRYDDLGFKVEDSHLRFAASVNGDVIEQESMLGLFEVAVFQTFSDAVNAAKYEAKARARGLGLTHSLTLMNLDARGAPKLEAADELERGFDLDFQTF